MKVKSESEVAQSSPILHDPMDCSPPGSSAPGIFQARVLEWVAIALSGKLITCWLVLQINKMLQNIYWQNDEVKSGPLYRQAEFWLKANWSHLHLEGFYAQLVKNPSAMQETLVQFLSQE